MSNDAATPRQLADQYLRDLAELDPSINTHLGLKAHEDRLADPSPAGAQAEADLARRTLETLRRADQSDPLEARCATLLQDRLTVTVDVFEAGEHLRTMRNIGSPPLSARGLLSLMPTETEDDWYAIGARMARLPKAFDQYRESLEMGRATGLFAAPRQAETFLIQLGEWLDGSWFHRFIEPAPEGLADTLDAAADAATDATAKLRHYVRDVYLPAALGTPDAVGEERYRLNARRNMGSDPDPQEAYEWGWAEYRSILAEQEALAGEILPGATPHEALQHLARYGDRVIGVAEIRAHLQEQMDRTINELNGTHFDIAEPLQRVEAMIAPAGAAAAPYYTTPSMDFSRPGQTWLPTLGRNEFPLFDLTSTWYHEGVPGHHLQLAQWTYVAPQLSMYQTSLGSSSGATEGWALYAERLMDELGYLSPQERMGYLDAQMMRAVRVVIDIGMHLQLRIPQDSPLAPGQVWTPELAQQFFEMHSGRPKDFIASEIVRYLGWPGQAISYKLGERTWMQGREQARANHAARGEAFDLKDWHMKALSLGALGLEALETELAAL